MHRARIASQPSSGSCERAGRPVADRKEIQHSTHFGRGARRLRWAGLVLCVAIGLAWALSIPWSWTYRRLDDAASTAGSGLPPAGLSVALEGGSVIVGSGDLVFAPLAPSSPVRWRSSWRVWWRPSHEAFAIPSRCSFEGFALRTQPGKEPPWKIERIPPNNGPLIRGRLWSLPLWIPFLLAGVPTAYLFLRGRQRPVGHCQGCGYDLTGNLSGTCPECGRRAHPAEDGHQRQADDTCH